MNNDPTNNEEQADSNGVATTDDSGEEEGEIQETTAAMEEPTDMKDTSVAGSKDDVTGGDNQLQDTDMQDEKSDANNDGSSKMKMDEERSKGDLPAENAVEEKIKDSAVKDETTSKNEGIDANEDVGETKDMDIDSQGEVEKHSSTSATEEKVEEPVANDAGTDDNSSKDLPYSTRGRSVGSGSGEEKIERPPLKEALDEPPKPKEPGVSFLESLSEEERRTRTRFLPDVEGMHTLRKNEIKEDLALARSLPTIASSQGNIQTRTVRLASSGRKKDTMMMDEDDPNLVLHDDRTTTIHLPTHDLMIPSDAFVAPEGVAMGESEGIIVRKETSKKEPGVESPSVVESVTAFNPPRPPESVGPKKKHRVIRWERRPEDIEVDMKNYRRTVQRTREELQKSEAEYERLETVDAHLRRHFLSQLELLNQEYKRLHDEMQIEVQKLMKESELVGSRTRSRNLTKVSVVMRDVLNGFSSAPTVQDQTSIEVPPTAVPGFGGLNAQAFEDWDRSSEIKPMKPAVSWVEPGQKVTTPYGEGTVIAVYPPEMPPATSDEAVGEENKRVTGDETRSSDFHKSSIRKKSIGSETENLAFIEEQAKYDSLKPMRFKVRLEYGEGIFGIEAINKMDSPANFSDAKLAARWKSMIDSALKVGPCIDVQGMSSKPEKQISDLDLNDPMTIDDGTKQTSQFDGSKISNIDRDGDHFLPIGASLFPTKSGRGNFLFDMKIDDIEKGLQHSPYHQYGVLGERSNPGVTESVRKWEDEEQEYLTLQASALQLKNALYRQRRIRILNERTSASMNERYQRAEELVAEMRSDLQSLKRRLEDELNELGISEEMASQILSKFYKGQDEDDKGDSSTPKRLRRASSVSREMMGGVDLGNINGGADADSGDPRDSMDEQGTDDLSGDDMEAAQRPAKKLRAST